MLEYIKQHRAQFLLAGYPERFAQEALGHKSKAVHRAYARKAKVIVPALETYESQNAEKPIIPLAVTVQSTGDTASSHPH